MSWVTSVCTEHLPGVSGQVPLKVLHVLFYLFSYVTCIIILIIYLLFYLFSQHPYEVSTIIMSIFQQRNPRCKFSIQGHIVSDWKGFKSRSARFQRPHYSTLPQHTNLQNALIPNLPTSPPKGTTSYPYLASIEKPWIPHCLCVYKSHS